MPHKLICVIAAFAMSGCVTAEQNIARVAAMDDAACHSYGAATGTDAYFQCRMIKDQQHDQDSQLAAQRFHEGFHHDLDMMSAALAPPPVIVVHPVY